MEKLHVVAQYYGLEDWQKRFKPEDGDYKEINNKFRAFWSIVCQFYFIARELEAHEQPGSSFSEAEAILRGETDVNNHKVKLELNAIFITGYLEDNILGEIVKSIQESEPYKHDLSLVRPKQ